MNRLGGVAKMWQDNTERPATSSNNKRVCAVQAAHANNDQHRPLPVPMFPWYY